MCHLELSIKTEAFADPWSSATAVYCTLTATTWQWVKESVIWISPQNREVRLKRVSGGGGDKNKSTYSVLDRACMFMAGR